MPFYMIQVGYTPESWAAMVKNPQDRIEMVRPAVEKLGGKVVSGYLTFGKYDVIAILDMPDNASAAAFAMSVAAGGGCSKVTTTPLMSTREGVNAMKKAGASSYRPPSARAPARAGAGKRK